MIEHYVRVPPSASAVPRGAQLAWKIAHLAVDPPGRHRSDRAQHIDNFQTLAVGVLEPAEVERLLDVAQRRPGLACRELAGLAATACPGVIQNCRLPEGIS
jgi:2-methylcitrate dehydratase